ncbi:VWA domain-containing protein [Tessaracoccus oleiagri]|uniref:Ca-activated chloride channel family protein n=1 Tax=Tessaracoccus oleiagri TaxID=686624 RepID=A0A1G9LV86_9ACTN|nr:VWA domain-containing protein [Tessaracoccus oleiagri]SDL65940.1 Ca-activated chloride channel family protein [Tessaracoccus oleiagri]
MFDWLPEFLSPQRLWSLLALPLLIVVYLVLLRLKKRVSLRFTNTGVLNRVVGGQRRWTRHVAVAMALASLVALALAWAQPLGTEMERRERATVIMVVDTSQSMQATDVEPSRLEAAKSEAQLFINELPESYNVALVALNGAPSVRMPPSTDRGALSRALGALQLADGTAIGGAIDEALGAIALAPPPADGEEPAPAMIVLLSDGSNTDGADPAQAVARAAEEEVPIHTIAFGTENGYVDIDGKRESVAPDFAALQQISEATGGRAETADSAESLRDAYQDLESTFGYEEVKKPITAQYAFAALGFAIIAALGAVMMAARWPK